MMISHDWVDALDNLILFNGYDDSSRIINDFFSYARNKGLSIDQLTNIPFENKEGGI